MSWHIDDTDPTRPVRLALGGPYPLRLTVTEAMSLLRTAPKMAGKWVPVVDGAQRRDAAGVVAAEVWLQSINKTGGETWIGRMMSVARDVSGSTQQEAQDAADAALRAAGWLLEEG